MVPAGCRAYDNLAGVATAIGVVFAVLLGQLG